MNENFITSIYIKKLCNIKDFEIKLSEIECKHLIITGKNGSGKTTLLNKIEYSLSYDDEDFSNHKYINIALKNREHFYQSCLFVLFAAKRHSQMVIPKSITKITLPTAVDANEKINNQFMQYIVNLKAERSFAKDDNEQEAVQRIDAWFTNFEQQLQRLFDAPSLQLIFDRKNYNFLIQIDQQEPFALNQLSDGYSAVMSIITELILRMEATGNSGYDRPGIVLIDEIETHLHVGLQKKILPFLCAFFPNIQFIVTTSPFVLSSMSNAVVCDLESREVITDLSGYSYDALVESYFEVDKYSEVLKRKVLEFEQLSAKIALSEAEQDRYYALKRYFDDVPTFLADELKVQLNQIKLRKMVLN